MMRRIASDKMSKIIKNILNYLVYLAAEGNPAYPVCFSLRLCGSLRLCDKFRRIKINLSQTYGV